MDRIDELNTSIGKLNLLTITKIVYTQVFDKMSARDDFLNLSEIFLWLNENDSNNTMGAFLRLVWLVLKSSRRDPNVLW
jgi:hypothetical protein